MDWTDFICFEGWTGFGGWVGIGCLCWNMLTANWVVCWSGGTLVAWLVVHWLLNWDVLVGGLYGLVATFSRCVAELF